MVEEIEYETLEVTRHEAKDIHFLKTMYHGAASKQGWHQGLYAEIVVKTAKVNDKPVIIVLPTSAVQESKDSAAETNPTITSLTERLLFFHDPLINLRAPHFSIKLLPIQRHIRS